MSQVSIVLDRRERELILKYGYPFDGIEAAIAAVPDHCDEAKLTFSVVECERLLGDLACSINRCRGTRLQLELDEIHVHIESGIESR